MAMLADCRVWDAETFWYKFEHLRQITKDACARPWPSIRSWSQRTFDRVETQEIEWSDTVAIQDDKHNFSVDDPQNGAPSAPTTGSKLAKQGNRTVRAGSESSAICVRYGKGQCEFDESHTEAGTFFEHACMY